MGQSLLAQQFSEKALAAHHIIIVAHQNPDGDAMGASLGLYNVLQTLHKQVTVIMPNESPSFLAWMPGADQVINYQAKTDIAKQIFSTADMLVMVDFNCSPRVKDMEPLLNAFKGTRVMIDHHPYPDTTIANILISNTEVSSSCELMYQIMADAGWSAAINQQAASCLYTGIMTDTGGLNHNSSRPETYHVVANLLEKGINKDEIHKLVFHSNSINRMRLLGYCLSQKLVLVPEHQAAYITLTAKELTDFNHQPGDSEGFVNYPLGIEGINVSALFIERDKQIKVSLRSRGDIAVNKMSEKYFNGGGHNNAAGGEWSVIDMDGIVQTYQTALKEFCKI
jgi:phosphoesterase RecJ-like protein